MELSATAAAVLDHAVQVEAAELSLVKALVETIKIHTIKDLNDDELDELLERPRSVLVRSDYLEPFREFAPLNHTLVSESRVSPSRSVGSVSPTNDLSLVPSEVEIALDRANVSSCNVLLEEEIIPAQPQEVTRPPMPPVDEEIIPAPPREVTRAPIPNFDLTALLIDEDNLPETVSALDDVYMLSVCSTVIELELYKAVETEVDLRECEDEMIVPEPTRDVRQPPMRWPEERSASPFVVDECFLELEALETVTLRQSDVERMSLEKASIVEDDICFVEEENFIVEATIDVQQLLKMAKMELMQSEERCVTPFADENAVIKPILDEIDLLTLAPQDHVTEPLACAQIHEADVYYFEEESMVVDVICDLTHIKRMTQRDLITCEERPVSPIQDEGVFVQPLSADVELISIDVVEHVESPLSQAKVEEFDLYYFEEESYSVDVVCDVSQLLQHSADRFSVEEHFPQETVQPESTVAETSAQPSEIKPTDVDTAAKNRSSETYVLAQAMVDHTEATSRLSPMPEDFAANSSMDVTDFSTALVDECAIYTHDEETFIESTLEQTAAFEQRRNSLEGRFDEKLEAQEEEISADVIINQKSGFKVPEDEMEMYSSGEETFVEENVVTTMAEEQKRVLEVQQHRKVPEDEIEMYSSGEETFTEHEIVSKMAFDQKRELEFKVHQALEVPEDEAEMYSSGTEETYDRWTVETYRMYVEKKKVEADVTLRRSRQHLAAAGPSHGKPLVTSLQCLHFLHIYINNSKSSN